MDLIKKLTGKNPTEYEPIAKSLVSNSDVELFAKLVKQDDFLFDFIKENVAKRIQCACNKENYKNIIPFFKYYSPSYDTMFGEVLHSFGGEEIYPVMETLFLNGTNDEKAYVAKYLSFRGNYANLLPRIREYAKSECEALSINSIELLAMLNDDVSKREALEKLSSNDEFVQYDGIRFLVNYGAKDVVGKIIDVMKKSSLSENIASEIPYLISLEELAASDFDNAILVLCHIINAIPDIVALSAVNDYNLVEVFNSILNVPMASSSALLLRMAKDKFQEFVTNEEYLFDSDRNTKESVKEIWDLLKNLDNQKLKSYFYDELYEDSDFVFYALDYADETEEIETLLDSKNQTLVLKALSVLKDKGVLTDTHKQNALDVITSNDIKMIVNAL